MSKINKVTIDGKTYTEVWKGLKYLWAKSSRFQDLSSEVEVSTFGNLRLKQTNTSIIPYKDKDGYFIFSYRSEHYTVHRSVLSTFVPNPLNLGEINHDDGDKGNNYLYNIQWCTRAENVSHAWDTGLQNGENKNVLEISIIYAANPCIGTFDYLMQKYNISRYTLTDILAGRSYQGIEREKFILPRVAIGEDCPRASVTNELALDFLDCCVGFSPTHSGAAMAKFTKVDQKTISSIVNRTNWKSLNWKSVEESTFRKCGHLCGDFLYWDIEDKFIFKLCSEEMSSRYHIKRTEWTRRRIHNLKLNNSLSCSNIDICEIGYVLDKNYAVVFNTENTAQVRSLHSIHTDNGTVLLNIRKSVFWNF